MKNWYIKIWNGYNPRGQKYIIAEVPANLQWSGETIRRDERYSEVEYTARRLDGGSINLRATRTTSQAERFVHCQRILYFNELLFDVRRIEGCVFGERKPLDIPSLWGDARTATVEEFLDGIGLTAAIREHEQEEASASK